ncbi:aminoglycoside phosphotransferase (APT) family kinase protein [Streptomyces sp. 3211.6]|uniref:phosphotransferase family protein n=1 Tax=Streptomyces sp. 3211.6 TaxID=1938845 RepID=UPI000F2367B3|nr:aminoglycoside phosphotransferase family protein [Streptomyces sp. 3211.6]RKT07740.1 aminoglycoside phosphotransferase (APT) family kinase protein [Streptomyces sp. 3211.6]
METTGESEESWAATRAWVDKTLSGGERVESAALLRGGWTSTMRRLELTGGAEGPRPLVLRSFVRPFYLRHAEGLLTREADVLRLLDGTDVPAAALVAVDATAQYCDHPSLLMSLLPGTVRLDGEEADRRAGLMARQLLAVHRLEVPGRDRPRAYQAWTSAERVSPPERTRRPGLWRRAVDAIRRDPPRHRACFLHRDFHPGNVLFEGAGAQLRISGVVDWVETSWGPADLDVAHCSTSLALLHGVPAGMGFADRYLAAGGTLAEDPADHLYWRLLDALAFAPDAEKVAVPWRGLGRSDLTPAVMTDRLEDYLDALLVRYG